MDVVEEEAEAAEKPPAASTSQDSITDSAEILSKYESCVSSPDLRISSNGVAFSFRVIDFPADIPAPSLFEGLLDAFIHMARGFVACPKKGTECKVRLKIPNCSLDFAACPMSIAKIIRKHLESHSMSFDTELTVDMRPTVAK